MKICFKCNKAKALSEFYRHPMMADGRLGKCKECTKRDVRKNYANNHEHYVAYDKARAMLPHRVQMREEYQATKAGKRAAARAHKKQIELYPHKYKARVILGNAVRDGKVKKLPCEVCGSTRRIHGHHEDYSRPLDVVWLCSKHHKERHLKKGL